MFKKIFSIVCLILTAFSVNAFADSSSEILSDIGIFTEASETDENSISRLEFVTSLIKGFFPDTALSENTENTFSDTNDRYAAYALNTGLVSGTSDGIFNPDTNVTYNQAVKMLINAIGYKADGEYPSGYLKSAAECGLIRDDGTADSTITREEAAQLILSGLNMYKVTYNEKGAAVYEHNKFIRKLGYTVVDGKAKKIIKKSEPLYADGEMPYAADYGQTPGIEIYSVEDNAPAVVFFPGGAYMRMSAIESAQIPEFLNSCGITAVLVNYRVAPYTYEAITADALKAMELIKERAAEFKINPKKIGIMGCSAGGHLAAYVSTAGAADEKTRPDFTILGYPVISMTDELTHADSRTNFFGTENPEKVLTEKYSNENNVTENTPQAFIFHAMNDSSVASENSVAYAYALKKHGINCELHLYPERGHGFANGFGKPRVGEWRESCRNWLKSIDIL